MRECIKRYNLSLLDVPVKYIYKIDGQWRIIAEHIPAVKQRTLTFQEMGQWIKLIEETGLSDIEWHEIPWHDTSKLNVRISKITNKLTFIDMENRSFAAKTLNNALYLRRAHPQSHKAKTLYNCFARRLAELEKNPNNIKKNEPIPLTTRFDAHGTNFERIRWEFEQIKSIDAYNHRHASSPKFQPLHCEFSPEESENVFQKMWRKAHQPKDE